MNKIIIRSFNQNDIINVINLFNETVHAINSRDYSQEQLDIWAPHNPNIELWISKLKKNNTFVAQFGNKIIGFADISQDGLLDHLYVHKDWQGKGVGKLLVQAIENKARELNLKTIVTDASITAKSFFEKMGFMIIKEQEVTLKGVKFINYLMEKKISYS